VESVIKPNPHFLIQPSSQVGLIDEPFQCSHNIHWVIYGDIPSHVLQTDERQILVYGDWINPIHTLTNDFDLDEFVQSIKGHCNIIVVERNRLRLIGSYFSFLPIYYIKEGSVLSNNWESIIPFSSRCVDELFLIESHLFNYPLGDNTLYCDVKLLASFTELCLQEDEFIFREHVDLKTWFPAVVDESIQLGNLSQKFIETIGAYFSEKRELVTFTSGFDGRTILASALAKKKDVFSFSMGRKENDDVYNPQSNALQMDISFEAIDLGGEDYQKAFLKSAVKMSKKSGGRNGFLYPHFYFCSEFYRDFSVLHTGYCGSELFRALHIAGAVTSRELVSIFLETDDEKLRDIIFKSNRIGLMQKHVIERNAQRLWNSIQNIRLKRGQFKNTNHFFYHFIFKEVFRKVFGFWTTTQFENIKVRTPFLDFEFVQLLLKSEYAGCNNPFFTHNPLKRYKGQLLYAQILKDLKSPLYSLMTGKRYTPRQLLSFIGQLSIILPYIKKKWKKKRSVPYIDNLGLITGYQRADKELQRSLVTMEDWYDLARVQEAIEKVNPYMSEVERDMLFQIASFSLTLRDDETCGANRL
jgi:hypothetical protein